MGIGKDKYIARRHTFLMVGVILLALTVLLTACGYSNGNGNSTTGAGTAQTPTAVPTMTTIAGYGTSQGCPSDVVVPAPPKPDETVTLKNYTKAVTAHPGDVIAVQFPFGQKWGEPKNVQSMLQMQNPSGFALKSNKTCNWDFVARSAGTTELSFSAQPICKAGEICPMHIMLIPVTINVTK
ncbi:MAG TPA: hypothetical protein VL461_05735 [Dictyobacter sp.]|jgi:hypothetical protein|nr:hypothetical protein [Dictyobacter sp.]